MEELQKYLLKVSDRIFLFLFFSVFLDRSLHSFSLPALLRWSEISLPVSYTHFLVPAFSICLTHIATMAIFKKKTESEGSGTDAETVSLSSKSTVMSTSSSRKGLIKRQTPFEHPIHPIKEPEFNLSKEEEEKYQQVLEHFKNYILQDIPVNDSTNAPKHAITDEEKAWLTKECFLRYLRATKWKVDAAIKRIEETLLWRRTFGVVEIPGHTDPKKKVTAELVEPENTTGKNLIVGYDNDNRPCLYLRNGYQNTSASIRQVQHLVFMLERVIQYMPPGQDTLALLIDFKAAPASMNLSAKFPSLSISKQVLHILQNHYPERLGRGLFTNIPWIGYTFFKVVGPFIDPYTRLKTIYDKPFENFVPKEQLDKEFNGMLDFEYVHEVYWPAMNEMAEKKLEVFWANFDRLGKEIGLSEYALKCPYSET